MSENESEISPKPRTHWLLRMILWLVIMGLGAIYGTTGYVFFERVFSVVGGTHNISGLMLLSFVAGVPFCIGAIFAYLVRRYKKISYMQAVSLTGLPILLFVFLAGAILREGFICILMALPLFIAFGLVGMTIYWIASAISKGRSNKVLAVFIVLPFAMGTLEQYITPPDMVKKVHRSIYIQAAPAVVWKHINAPVDIRPAELSEGLAYRIGAPYPLEVRTPEPWVGGMRQVYWQRGVFFQERITAWEPERYLAWQYVFTPQSFPPGSLDDHIVIGGHYFNLEDTSYTLTPEAGGTRLDMTVQFRVSTDFNWYAVPWARFLMGDTAETLLKFYKHRSEAA